MLINITKNIEIDIYNENSVKYRFIRSKENKIWEKLIAKSTNTENITEN